MKGKLIALSRRYVTALRKHLKQGRQASLKPAHRLGCQAVAIGLETLDVARIHERALAGLERSSGRDRLIERAQIFFCEAITPIEKTHHAALEANVRLSQLNETLGRRKSDLAASRLCLKKGIVRRKTAERALKKSGQRSKKLLEESQRLQRHLRRLAHRILSAQEDKRKEISHNLQNEVAQTLLGINVRLLTLKKGAAVSTQSLKKEIASTQQLVDMSERSIKGFAREIGKQNQA